jgi:2-keto-4-pentenoate hydratase/2-oxohepta-3-ene-1,7-dioic acid hydratase in catechol pathway
MRVVRFGEVGAERPGLWRDGRIVDLRAHFPEIPDIGDLFFREGWLDRIGDVEDEGMPADVRLGPPVACPSKIICLGKNYAEHAKEGGFDTPERPLLFCKANTSLNGPCDPIRLPVSTGQVDWEVELAVVIGRGGRGISRETALEHVAGYTIMNDVSGREAQFGDGQWFRGKSFDTFAPLGPHLVTPDELGDPEMLTLESRVNGELMQRGRTADMIFDIPFLIAYISEDITLLPGDIISTGTPSGVGIFRNPPITLSAGDEVECRIEGIGALRNRCEGAV